MNRSLNKTSISKLSCNYLNEPLGIDDTEPRLSWEINDIRRGACQKAYQILVASSLKTLSDGKGDLWDTGKVDSEEQVQIKYTGKTLNSRMECFWKVKIWDKDGNESDWSKPSFWTIGLISKKDWKAKWIGYDKEVGEPYDPTIPYYVADEYMLGENKLYLPPPPYLRKEFQLPKEIKKATAYVSALGIYELRINGKKVDNDYFTPGWSDYTKRIYYQTYDITGMMHAGNNVVGAILADGWYAGYVGLKSRHNWGDLPRLITQIEIEYMDGSNESIVSDSSWRASYGPILEADLLHGESYDARREIKDWDQSSFDDRSWDKVEITENIDILLKVHPGPRVKKIFELKAKKIKSLKTGIQIFDMGKNMVGVVRLKVKGPEGTKITIRHGEILNPDGTLYTENLRSARATDTYIFRGEGEEIFEPRFTFHGFRYVEITGIPYDLDADDITGIVISSANKPAGSFKCSNELVNDILDCVLWSIYGNFLEVATDCPQRDERLGWGLDGPLFMRAASYLGDMASFINKWVADVIDGQKESGTFWPTAPAISMGDIDVFLGDITSHYGILLPWIAYKVYRDKNILRKYYEPMKRYFKYLENNNDRYIRNSIVGGWLEILENGFTDYDHGWGNTPRDICGTAYFAQLAGIMKGIAKAIGNEEDEKHYAEILEKIKKAFNASFVLPGGRLKQGNQTAYALALAFDLLPEEIRVDAVKNLVNDIKEKGYHITTGLSGTLYLNPVLSKYGYHDIACRLITDDTYPGWGYMVRQGATTIWERWDGLHHDKGLHPHPMNSFNHPALGSVGEWIYTCLAGIDLKEPGFKEIDINPGVCKEIDQVSASYDSIYGEIKVDWTYKDGKFSLDCTIPPNTSAEISIPADDAKQIKEGGKPAESSEGIKYLHNKDRKAVFQVLSGKYNFSSDYKL
ncbi:family 78 glycoside hydrolase catalytic domain [Actinomycetota bacterium]